MQLPDLSLHDTTAKLLLHNAAVKFEDGTATGRSDGAFNGRPTSDPKELRILELRYSTIRAQALTPRESLAFIEQLLGET